jgi:hypothetical protein
MYGDDIWLSVESLSLMHYTNSRVWIEDFYVEEHVGCESEVMAPLL